MDSVHHIWCPLSSQEYQDLPDGAETTLTLHWGEGEIRVSRDRIAHIGRLAPGPDYKLYLAPRFVDTKEAFLLIKDRSVRVGDVKTFNGFIVEVPAGIDVRDYNTVVIWCEAFDQFISAAEYQPSSQARERARRWIP